MLVETDAPDPAGEATAVGLPLALLVGAGLAVEPAVGGLDEAAEAAGEDEAAGDVDEVVVAPAVVELLDVEDAVPAAPVAVVPAAVPDDCDVPPLDAGAVA